MKYLFLIVLMFGFVGMTYPNTLSADVHTDKAELVKDVGTLDVVFVAEVSDFSDMYIDSGCINYADDLVCKSDNLQITNRHDMYVNDVGKLTYNYNYLSAKNSQRPYRRSRDGLNCK